MGIAGVRRRGRALLAAGATSAALCAVAMTIGAGASAVADEATQLPPIRHVFVINLENFSFADSFPADPFHSAPERAYLAGILPSEGVKIENYFGIGHNSLTNYIAQISGQAPNPSTQGDCQPGIYSDFSPSGAPLDPHGQVAGQGCVLPASVRTVVDQLSASDLTWKGYMEDMGFRAAKDGGFRCGHPVLNNGDPSGMAGPDKYATKHNPFMYFHSIIDDDANCRQHVVPFDDLFTDLQRVDTTPNLAYISPNLCDDGHDGQCTDQYTFDGKMDGRLPAANRFMAWLVPRLLASPAYRQDGMIVVTFDEADTTAGVSDNPDDSAACCNEIPGPNSSSPGITGLGGGQTGTVVITPYSKPASTAPGTSEYNHYSLLRSIEDVFGVSAGGTDGQGHLGFAAAGPGYPGPGAFGNDVYNRIPGQDGVPGPLNAPAPRDPTDGQAPIGPRAAEASVSWLAPGPQGNDLNAVSCSSADTCVAVGDTGTVLVRSGAGWSSVATSLVRDLLGVTCTTAGRCLAVGEHGLAIASSDNGMTWTASDTGTDRTLRGVACTADDACYAVGDGGTIVRSGDAGSTWAKKTSGVDQPLAAIDCPSDGLCFVTGGEKAPVDLVTHDGGGTWSSTNSAARDEGTGISCPTTTTCAISTPNRELRLTRDGAATWSVANPGGSGFMNRLLAVDCTSTTSCYVAANRAGIFKLGDDGSGNATLVAQTPGAVGDDLRGMSCVSATRCYAVGDRGEILATTDGQHWSSERTGPAPRTPGAPFDTTVGTLRSVSCPASGGCVAVGDEGSIARSADGRTAWTPRPSGIAPIGSVPRQLTTPALFGVDCASAGVCVAVGGYGTILRSDDGGDSWTGRPSPVSQASSDPRDLYGVSCATAPRCVAAGSYGEILTSDDAGMSWTRIASPSPYALNGVSCSAGGTCAAVGSFGTLITSPDGGRNWTVRDSGTPAYLAAVSCPADDSCVAVGQNGTVVSSRDGGATWAAHDAGVDDGLQGVDCSSALVCTATGSAGTVLKSGDGGRDWTVVGTGTSRGLLGTACIAANRCLAVGEDASVLDVRAEPPAAPPADNPAPATEPDAPASDTDLAPPAEPVVSAPARPAGPAGAPSVSRPRCTVPRVSGRRLAAARRLLVRRHCGVGRIVRRRSHRRAGVVVGQRPRPGTVRPAGSRVTLIVRRRA